MCNASCWLGSQSVTTPVHVAHVSHLHLFPLSINIIICIMHIVVLVLHIKLPYYCSSQSVDIWVTLTLQLPINRVRTEDVGFSLRRSTRVSDDGFRFFYKNLHRARPR
jgi:hypothetical protein